MSEREIDEELALEAEAAEEKEEKRARRALRKKAKAAERNPVAWRDGLRRKVGIFYDLQRLRIQTAGRGLKKGDDNPVQLHEIDVIILDERSNELKTAEKNALNDIKDHLSTSSFYREVLSDKERFKGIGPTLAAVILSEFDIYKAETVSQMWSFAGLSVKPAIRCKECQTVVKDVKGKFEHATNLDKIKCSFKKKEIPKSGTFTSAQRLSPTKGEKLPYNKFLKTKLVGVAAGCLLKANSPWRKFYDDYKHRKESAGWGASPGHRHAAAMRYMIKMMLVEIHKLWREHLDLPVRAPYQEQYLGHTHHTQEGAAAQL